MCDNKTDRHTTEEKVGTMKKKLDSPQVIIGTNSNSIEPNRQQKAGTFHFPGSLSLQMKHLVKGDSIKDYDSLYRLRYQVYCHEAGFLNPDNYPTGLECDKFDIVAEMLVLFQHFF